jgi:hypothetical protein
VDGGEEVTGVGAVSFLAIVLVGLLLERLARCFALGGYLRVLGASCKLFFCGGVNIFYREGS